MTHDRRERARERRTFVRRLGLLVIAAATCAACIFDQGNGYQGGGRVDRGASAGTPSSSSTATSTTTASSSSSSSSSPDASGSASSDDAASGFPADDPDAS